MKTIPLLLALAGAVVLSGCDAVVVAPVPQPAYYSGTVWVGPGYYSGVYYRSSDSYYYDHPSYRYHKHDKYVKNETRNTTVVNNTVNQVNVNRSVVNKTVYNNGTQNNVVVQQGKKKKKKKDQH
ncbi:MAG: hypothetical protein QM796_21575 [Chthoniobacteraceae bacterium]